MTLGVVAYCTLGAAPDANRLAGLHSNDVVFTEPTMQQLDFHWETDKTKPWGSQLAAIAAVRKLGKRAVMARLGADPVE